MKDYKSKKLFISVAEMNEIEYKKDIIPSGELLKAVSKYRKMQVEVELKVINGNALTPPEDLFVAKANNFVKTIKNLLVERRKEVNP